ncbi:MAG: dihydroorotase [Sphaerochaetaceae bacterium]|nr:dihydroorotase [Sphaerochaetaceae bacterium]
MVDPHVHLRDWNDSNKETIYHGLKVAYDCGINEVFDMPNTNPPLISREAILDRLSLANEAIMRLNKKDISYHIYAGLTKDPKQIAQVVSAYNELFPLVIGLKLFAGHSTGGMGIISDEDQQLVFNTLVKENYKGVLTIHCEKESLLDNSKFNKKDLSTQSIARAKIAEVESIKDIINLAKTSKFEGTIHVAHLSTKEGLEIIECEKAKKNTFKLSCAVTAHHALLTKLDANEKSFAKMNPPLRDEEDRLALFNALLNGGVDFIESDHAPHTIEDKIKGASGVPGFSGTLLLIKALIDNGISRSRIKDLMGRNVYKTFDLDPDGVNFNIKSVPKLKEISLLAAKEYPYDAFISLR